jgi:hypothetical protein
MFYYSTLVMGFIGVLKILYYMTIGQAETPVRPELKDKDLVELLERFQSLSISP